ncbi:tetratricopeptide repeat protein [Pontibacterium sp. N1Y112]|uniref:Tetratricopeptide repeat protein n=1 Tax=Pontibacterium sinense TaxID=2781979 RepID=A0A8J7FGI0_9GAMM|nr:tetratricopeptide repeat protein [Pontibacterium sinense]MBE9399199.1 tetratricopeptide repeat protein [Pontibacterium sinense]
MASLQNAPGKKRWLPLAIAAVIAGVVAYSVMDSSDNSSSPAPQVTSDATDLQSLQQANRYLRNGQYQNAMTAVDQVLAADEDNMDAQLLKATLLSKTGRSAQAETLLNELREQYPDRPEPLNNLAVMYAEAGDNSRAIQTLQSAFKTHPSYAQVYQNLSDMYAVLAAEAYNKALGVSGTDRGPQLVSLSQFGYPTAIGMHSAPLFEPKPELQAQEETPAPEVATVVDIPSAAPEQEPENIELNIQAAENLTTDNDLATEELAVAEAIGISEATPATPLPYTNVVMNQADSEAISAAQNPAQTDRNDAGTDTMALSASPEELAIARETERAAKLLASLEADQLSERENERTAVKETPPAPEKIIEGHLKSWAKAWSEQNVQAYVRAYVAGYKPNNGVSHKQWVQTRTNRLTSPDYIKVALSDIDVVMLSDSRAEATFRQSYRSDRYRDVARKRISLMRRSSGWKIVQEGSL